MHGDTSLPYTGSVQKKLVRQEACARTDPDIHTHRGENIISPIAFTLAEIIIHLYTNRPMEKQTEKQNRKCSP